MEGEKTTIRQELAMSIVVLHLPKVKRKTEI